MNCRKVDKKSPNGKTYTYFVVDLGMVDGRRERRNFKSRDEARAFMRDWRMKLEKYGSATALSQQQMAIAIDAFSMLASNGMSSSDLLLATSQFVESHNNVVERIPMSEAVSRYVASLDSHSNMHVRILRSVLVSMAERIGKDRAVADVKDDDVTAFMTSCEKEGVAPKTFNNRLAYVHSFFNWLMKQKLYPAENPVTVAKKRVAYKDPEFISVEDAKALFEALDGDTTLPEKTRHLLINFYTLSFFGGIRTSEIFRIKPEDVHPEDNVPFVRISITKGAAKGIRGRTLDLEPNAVAWLTKYPFAGQISENAFTIAKRDAVESVLKDVSNALVHNVGRHSYITYHVALHRDCARTEAYVGTSASMRARHYQGLTTSDRGKSYFGIFPS